MSAVLASPDQAQLQIFLNETRAIARLAEQSSYRAWLFVSPEDAGRPISDIPIVCAERMVARSRSLRTQGFHDTTHGWHLPNPSDPIHSSLYNSLEAIAQKVWRIIPAHYWFNDPEDDLELRRLSVNTLVEIAKEMRDHGYGERAIEWLAVASQSIGERIQGKAIILTEYKACLNELARHNDATAYGNFRTPQDVLHVAIQDANGASLMGDKAREQTAVEWVNARVALMQRDPKLRMRAEIALENYIGPKGQRVGSALMSDCVRSLYNRLTEPQLAA